MPRKLELNKPHIPLRRLVYATLAFSISMAGISGQAQAGCAGPIAKDAAATSVSMGKSIVSAGLLITQAFIELNDSLTRYANQISNDDQNMVKTQQSLSDRVSVQDNAGTVGQARAEVAQQFIPSKVVCGIVSQQQRMNATQVSYAATRTALQTANTSFSNNGPGSGAERGTLQAMNTGFRNRCDRYANPATMNAPAAINCPSPAADPALRDLDIQPWKALLDPIMFSSASRKLAAEDAVKMLTELAPPDPIRGNVLLRSEGQNLHVMRMRDVTRMNLARGVLEDIVALRAADPAVAGSKSRLATYIELITGQEYNPATNSLSGQLQVIMAAGEQENAAVQTISARLATQQALIFELLRLGEQITMLDATALAIKVERSRSSGASVSARPISN